MTLFRAVAAALTGEDPAESNTSVTDAAQIVQALAELGWSRERIAEHRTATLEDGERWPHPISAELRGEVGAAQASATLASVRKLLAVDGAPRLRSAEATLDQRDRQLIADLPPHHVQR